jgi:bifunctional UDP-N-acetylglucosamine pyrophosphorylase/glucosamine-1-phosphate N-acetyltransferase
MDLERAGAYGRVVRDATGAVTRIVEAVDATAEQLALREVNSGVGVWDADWLWPALESLAPSPSGEYYLTDLVAQAAAEGRRVAATKVADATETLGVNSRADLAAVELAVRDRIRNRHLAAGITLVTPGSVWIDEDVRLGRDTVVWPNTFLMGRTTVGEGATLGPGSVIRDAELGDGVTVELSVVESAHVGPGCRVGPFAHVRGGTWLDEGVRIGNYAEVKASKLGSRVRAGHFSYIGDTDVGEGANIGAGTVTANYDGVTKHRTVIGAGAFIGSGSVLVAPVAVGEGAITGAGSVVTRDVAPGETVVGVPARPLRSEGGDAQ